MKAIVNELPTMIGSFGDRVYDQKIMLNFYYVLRSLTEAKDIEEAMEHSRTTGHPDFEMQWGTNSNHIIVFEKSTGKIIIEAE